MLSLENKMQIELGCGNKIVTDIDEGWDFRCPKKTLLGSANERMQECITQTSHQNWRLIQHEE